MPVRPKDGFVGHYEFEFGWGGRPIVVSHKYVTKFMWDILVQLSSLQVSGCWPLAAGLLPLVTGCLSLGRPEASSQQQEA